MPRYEDVVFNEDIDLSGGPAAIEANLNQYGGYTMPTGDEIRSIPQPGLRIVRIMTEDETPLTAAAFGDIAIDGRRGGDISLPLASPDGPGILDLGEGIPWPPNTDINCLGNASGVGAEQHTVVLRVLNPNKESEFDVQAAPSDGEVCIYEMPTDANTADTMDNPVDICGRLNAYTNGQTALPDDGRVEIWLRAIRMVVPAGQGGIYLLGPSQNHAYVYPAPALANVRIDFEKEFGGALYCTADAPILVGSVGTATTLIPLVLEMVVRRPAGE